MKIILLIIATLVCSCKSNVSNDPICDTVNTFVVGKYIYHTNTHPDSIPVTRFRLVLLDKDNINYVVECGLEDYKASFIHSEKNIIICK